MNSELAKKAVVDVCEVSMAVIRGKSREGGVVIARQILIWLLYHEVGFSYRRCATMVNRHRTLTYHALTTVDDRRKSDAQFQRVFERVCQQLGVKGVA